MAVGWPWGSKDDPMEVTHYCEGGGRIVLGPQDDPLGVTEGGSWMVFLGVERRSYGGDTLV